MRLQQLGSYDKILGKSVETVVLKQGLGEDRKAKNVESTNKIRQKTIGSRIGEHFTRGKQRRRKIYSQGGRWVIRGLARKAEQQQKGSISFVHGVRQSQSKNEH